MDLSLDALNLLTSEAILRAEALEDVGAPGTAAAHLEVSMFEERLAAMIPASSPAGALARHGAVGAAVLGGRPDRAEELTEFYSADPDASADLRAELAALVPRLQEERRHRRAEMIARDFPAAAAHYGADEIVRLAEAIACQAEPLLIG